MTDQARSVRIVAVEFYQFKALTDFTLRLSDVNILTGPNNCGKSTILGAFRALDTCLRRARSRNPSRLEGPSGAASGHQLAEESMPLALENVHTDYADVDSHVRFRLSNGNRLLLYFPRTGGCFFIPETDSGPVGTAAQFRKQFPIGLTAVPVLGPVEHQEEPVQEKTVSDGLSTHRASRHFRNYWRQNADAFPVFAELVKDTWPTMEVGLPEYVTGNPTFLAMFCREDGIARELYWSGFGFQVWCQLLTHIARSAGSTLLVIDEPEIYLHPDVQRQLLGVLRDAGPDILLATHSTEIIAEADVSEIVDIDKKRKTGKRLREIKDVQAVMEAIGSVHNVTLTKLARTRRVLFVEGLQDFKRLRRFARRLGLTKLSQGEGVTPVSSGGFSSWTKVRDLANGLEQTLGTSLKIAAVYDRDFWCNEEVDGIRDALSGAISLVHFHGRKELENYLVDPVILQRALSRLIDRETPDARQLLEELSDPDRTRLQAQYIAKREKYFASNRLDSSTVVEETIRQFDDMWSSLDHRMSIVSGKVLLSELRNRCQTEWGINLTDARIIDTYTKDEVPADLAECLHRLDTFRSS